MIWRRRLPPNPRQQLVQDVVRVAGFLEAIRVLADDLDAPEVQDLVTASLLLRVWLFKLRQWAEEGS